MKIEIGKTYKSNIPDRNNFDPSKSIPENWTIHSFLSESNSYLAYCHKVDGVKLWREFDADGNDGRTKTGNLRRLIPNTRTVVKWGYMYGFAGRITTLYMSAYIRDTKAEIESVLVSLPPNFVGYPVQVSYEVEE